MGDLIGTEQAGHATEEATSGSVTSRVERLPQPRLPVSDAIRLPAFMMNCPSGSENISRWDLVKTPPTASIAGQQDLQVDAGVEQDTSVGPDRQDVNADDSTQMSDESADSSSLFMQPNSAMSASHPAPPAQAVSTADATVASTAQGSEDDIDENWKRRGAAVKSSSAGPRQWMPVASSLYPGPSSSSSKLSFLDKVESHPAAPRSVAISPYGSAHPLHFTAKKYLLRVGLPSSSTNADTDKAAPATASQSRATKAASEQEQEQEQETEQAEPVKEEYKASVADLQEVADSFRAPSLSRLSPVPPLADTEEEDMGSRAAYARSQMRKQRRPSPLDLPAAKRRRSSSGPVSVVKVEETEDETTFLMSRKEPLRPTSATSRLPAPSRQSPAPTQQTLPTTPFSAATEKQRAASPASSVDLRSTLADEDCSCLDNELRTPTLRVPLCLPRPDTVKDFDLASLELDESLKGVPVPYILDNIALRGPLLLSSVVDSSIALPSTSTLASSPSSGSAIPSSVAVRTPTRLAQDSALPEYALAVSSDDTHQVMFLPVHGLVLATNCKAFAGVARPPPVELQSSEEGEDTIRILPVVHIHLPSSVSFSKLIPFFYTNEAGSLLSSLLPIHELPQLSLTASQKSPALLASHLAKLDQSILAQYIHFNHSTWKTAVALGAGKDELWTVLQGAWNALIAALSIQHKQSLRPKVEQDESEIAA